MKAINPISNGLLPSTKLQSTTCRAAFISSHQQRVKQQRRPFVSNPFNSSPQSLTAQRTLRYPSTTIYEIISDVSSYSHFLPYCQSSTVTKSSSPHPSTGKTYPEEAILTIGFNDSISESFTSRVYCVPNTTVEAVSGSTSTTLPAADIGHHSTRAQADAAKLNTTMTHLLTRWTLRPYPYKPPPTSATTPATAHKNHEETSDLPGQEKTEVNLAIEFQFANPVYAALSAAAAPGIAEKMIEAFEKRVKAVVEGPGHVDGKARGDGVLGRKM